MGIPDYNDRIVSFIDILGFEALVKSFAENPARQIRLHQALNQIKSIERISKIEKTVQYDLEVSVFSDSIVISSVVKHLHSLIWTCGYLQADLLFLGVLIRGGISIGATVHDKGILYGEGYLKAYRLESQAAVYPRIVLDPEISSSLSQEYQKRFMLWGDDGLNFIAPFKFQSVIPGADELAADGYNPRGEYLKQVREYLIQGSKEASTADQHAKWAWIIKYYNAEVVAYNRMNIEKLASITK